jgi:hypothetical protein
VWTYRKIKGVPLRDNKDALLVKYLYFQIRDEKTGEIVYRKITLNLIRLELTEKYRSRKFSLNRKRLYASYEPDSLLNL